MERKNTQKSAVERLKYGEGKGKNKRGKETKGKARKKRSWKGIWE